MKTGTLKIHNRIYKIKDGWVDYSDYIEIRTIKEWLKI